MDAGLRRKGRSLGKTCRFFGVLVLARDERGEAAYLLLLGSIALFLLLELASEPPEGTIGRASRTGRSLSSVLLLGNTDGSLGLDESSVKLLSKGRGMELGEQVDSSESLDSGELSLLLQAVLLSLVGSNTLVNLLKGHAGLGDLGVLLVVHRASTEISGVGNILVLIQKVLPVNKQKRGSRREDRDA